MQYYSRKVLNEVVLDDMRFGYRINYGNTSRNKDSKSNLINDKKLQQQYERTPVSLPPVISAGNILYEALKRFGDGVAVHSDQSYKLHANCLSNDGDIHVYSSFGDVDAHSRPYQLEPGKSVALFSYKKFLAAWHRFLVDGSPRPNIEIEVFCGKPPKKRDNRTHLRMKLIPKAARTMLKKIGSQCDNKTETALDNILHMFNKPPSGRK